MFVPTARMHAQGDQKNAVCLQENIYTDCVLDQLCDRHIFSIYKQNFPPINKVLFDY